MLVSVEDFITLDIFYGFFLTESYAQTDYIYRCYGIICHGLSAAYRH